VLQWSISSDHLGWGGGGFLRNTKILVRGSKYQKGQEPLL